MHESIIKKIYFVNEVSWSRIQDLYDYLWKLMLNIFTVSFYHVKKYLSIFFKQEPFETFAILYKKFPGILTKSVKGYRFESIGLKTLWEKNQYL